MPTVLRDGPYRFFFYAGEDRAEPPHVHVERDNLRAKFWLETVRPVPGATFNPVELRRVQRIVREHQRQLMESWYDNVSE